MKAFAVGWFDMLHREAIDWTSVGDKLVDNIKNDFWNGIAITGRQGRGKSRLAYLLCKYVGDKLGVPFDYVKNYIGNPEHGETLRKLDDASPRSCNWIDEAGTVLGTEKRLTKEQTRLADLFDQFRSKNKTVILCTPSFKRIDPRWRITHIHIWIHVVERGKAVLLVARDMQSTLDVWGLKEMYEKEITMKADGQNTLERVLQNFDANPAALFYFKFPDWEAGEKQEYLKYKEESQRKFRELFERDEKLKEKLMKSSRSEFALGRICTYLLWKHNTSYSELGKVCGYSDEKIREVCNKYVELFATEEEYAASHPASHFGKDYMLYVMNVYNNKKTPDVL